MVRDLHDKATKELSLVIKDHNWPYAVSLSKVRILQRMYKLLSKLGISPKFTDSFLFRNQLSHSLRMWYLVKG